MKPVVVSMVDVAMIHPLSGKMCGMSGINEFGVVAVVSFDFIALPTHLSVARII